MARYKIVFKRSVATDLRRIPNKDVQRILQRIEALADEPRPPGAEKLTAEEIYRLRQGNYRVLLIHDDVITVTVVKVGHRRDVYR